MMSKTVPQSASPGTQSIRAGLDEILDKSCALMAHKGFHGTSMRDISAETGRSLAGLYHYFRSKEDLLFLINFHGFQTLIETWKQMNKAFMKPEEKLYAFIFLHTHYFSEHINAMRVMTWGTQALSLENARVIEGLKDQYTREAKKTVREVSRSAYGRQLNERRLARETYILFGMMNWMFGWYSPRKHGRVRHLIADIYRTFVHGLGNRGARQSDLDRMDESVNGWFEKNGARSMW
jgi:AcrR family transcriptional regulator